MAEDGLSSAIEVDPEFDTFMLAQTISDGAAEVYSDTECPVGDAMKQALRETGVSEHEIKSIEKAAKEKGDPEAGKDKGGAEEKVKEAVAAVAKNTKSDEAEAVAKAAKEQSDKKDVEADAAKAK